MKRELHKSRETTSASITDSSESEYESKTDDPPSYQPDPRARVVKIRSGKDGTLKKCNNDVDIPKFSEKFYQKSEMPVAKVINSEKSNSNKRPAPPLPTSGLD